MLLGAEINQVLPQWICLRCNIQVDNMGSEIFFECTCCEFILKFSFVGAGRRRISLREGNANFRRISLREGNENYLRFKSNLEKDFAAAVSLSEATSPLIFFLS